MEKEFIPYEEALALKELGFNAKCCGAFDKKKKLQISTSDYWDNQSLFSLNGYFGKNTYRCLAPLYQQAFRWFREKYEIDGWVIPYMSSVGKSWCYIINFESSNEDYDTYEIAQLFCIKELIEIVKQKYL